jgi:hypothetical protein
MGQSAVAGEQDTFVGPGRDDDFQSPAVCGGGVKSSPEEPGDVHPASSDGAQPGARQVGRCVRGAVLGVGVAIPGDLLSCDGVEEAVAVVRDDHHLVVAGARVRGASDPEKSDRRVRAAPPGLGRREHGAARSLSRISRWYAESFGSRPGRSTGASFFVHFVTQRDPHFRGFAQGD